MTHEKTSALRQGRVGTIVVELNPFRRCCGKPMWRDGKVYRCQDSNCKRVRFV